MRIMNVVTLVSMVGLLSLTTSGYAEEIDESKYKCCPKGTVALCEEDCCKEQCIIGKENKKVCCDDPATHDKCECEAKGKRWLDGTYGVCCEDSESAESCACRAEGKVYKDEMCCEEWETVTKVKNGQTYTKYCGCPPYSKTLSGKQSAMCCSNSKILSSDGEWNDSATCCAVEGGRWTGKGCCYSDQPCCDELGGITKADSLCCKDNQSYDFEKKEWVYNDKCKDEQYCQGGEILESGECCEGKVVDITRNDGSVVKYCCDGTSDLPGICDGSSWWDDLPDFDFEM